MKRPNISKVLRIIRTTTSKHSPEILTGIGIAGMVVTTVMAVRATPKALRLIEEEKDRMNEKLLEEAKEAGLENCRQVTKLEPAEVIKTAWKPYIPVAVTGVVSIACLIGSNSVSMRRNAALAAAYRLSETALTEYRDKVIETVGEKKEQVIKDKVAKERMERNPVSNKEVIITKNGDTLCYDVISGRYFRSDIDKIKKAQNELNHELVSTMYVSLNDLYYILGLKPTGLGDDLGWNIDDGLIDISFSSQLADNGTPCLAMDYRIAPRYDYRDFG